MPPPHMQPTTDWFQMQQEIYSLSWKTDLSKFMIAGAPFGGPIAMIRDDKTIQLLGKQQSVKPTIFIYTSAGKLMEQLLWDKGRIVGMGWTDQEQLTVVIEDGTIRLYNIHGEYTQFTLGNVAKDCGVVDCQIWGTGLVALTGNYQLIAVTNFDEPRPRLMADPGLRELPHSWAVIPPRYTLSRHVEVLLATGSTILVVDQEAQDQLLQQGPFTKMAVSPNGKFLALFTTEGKILVVSTDFQKNLSEFGTKSKIPPQQLVWCGTDSVILYWDTQLKPELSQRVVLMVGPFGDWIKYSYDDAIYLIPEVDGARIMSADKCEFLQKVPNQTEEIFKSGSTSPAALLYDALDHFEKKSPKADENIRTIKTDLADAVDACIEAAGYEFVHHYQRTLLKAASFGKCFLEQYNADRFVNMCQTMRVLNAVRYYEIGIPITYAQYIRLTPEVLIDRLINRHHHLLAVRVADYLKMRTDRILIHWACSKIKKSTDDDEDTICNTIVEKLANKPGLSYAEIAKTAYKAGQPKLATKLLNYEPRAADQVPLLISMQEDELALIKAIESGDTDLVYLVIFHLKRKLPLGEFFRVINNKPLACNLLEVYCKEQDKELLRNFYYQDDRRVDSATITILESFDEQDLNDRINKLKVGLKFYQEDKDYNFEAKAIDESIKLLQLQGQLEKEILHTFIGLSVSQTIHKCVTVGQLPKATKIKTDFKVPDKRFWWIKLQALVEIRDFENLEKLAKSKKSPIGYEPFVDECIKAMQYREAAKYILKCDPPTRAALFVKIGSFKEAAEQAFMLKDVNALRWVTRGSFPFQVQWVGYSNLFSLGFANRDVRAKCTNHVIRQEIDSFIAQLASK
ncbi:Vps16, N-terminal region-domain-containing protein [Jimgerdemannia flammicorona]|uniref:Probable vacuolar protein sorting-associated protein 16 homolog n=1 Tax=Jimgerdemannia flammicorona TaxID=994334 RepID=A0A433QCQ8_9FUNG|nr:Vps16, N-terminal region-domain-containing protein [Jimgerdemannia flammicorona]